MATVASCNMSQNWRLHSDSVFFCTLAVSVFSHLSLIKLQKLMHTHHKDGAFETLGHHSDDLSMDTV